MVRSSLLENDSAFLPISRMKIIVKQLLFPGLDLHTRARYRFLPRYFRKGPVDTLDAGCGNGALAYAAYKLGNNVLGISIDTDGIYRCQKFFSLLGVDSKRLQFKVSNIYDLPKLNREFDQIICTETLEHIKDDRAAIRNFYDILRPGGILHLCSPYALYPDHNLGRTAGPEDGRHVRDGYTLKSYEALLEPVGFKIIKSVGVISPFLVWADRSMRAIRNKAGDAAAMPMFFLTLPLQLLDFLNPKLPFSLYAQAVKTGQ